MSQVSVITPFAKRSLGKVLVQSVSAALQHPEHRREFEAWDEKTYGKKYTWKKGSGNNETSS